MTKVGVDVRPDGGPAEWELEMTMTPTGTSVTITIVQAPACHLCADAESVVARLASEFPIACQVLDISSEQGLALMRLHRPAMNPLVLVDGRFFSAGRLPRGKLRATLEEHAALEQHAAQEQREPQRCDPPARVG